MKSQDRYFVGPGLRSKLRQMVDAFDGATIGSGGTKIPVRLQDGGFGGGGQPQIRLGKINSTWNKGAIKEVTRLHGDGALFEPFETFDATNYFADIVVDCGERKVACALVEGLWILIAAEC